MASRWMVSLRDFLDRKIGGASYIDASSYGVDELAARRAAFYIATSYIGNALSKCELRVYRDGKRAKGDPLEYALNVRPNPNQNGSQFMSKLVEHYFYEGHALMVQPLKSKDWFYIADGFGFDYKPLSQHEFTNIEVDNGYMMPKAAKMDECCYFKLENVEVRSIVDGLYRDYGVLLASAMESYRRATGEKFVYHRGTRPTGTREERKSDADEVNDALKDFVKGGNGVLPLPIGHELERLQAASSAATSADVIALRKDIYETVAAAFKIPVSMMYGNMTNTSDIVNQFVTFAVDPLAQMMSDEMTGKFFTPEQAMRGCRISVDTSRVQHLDMFQVADKADKLISSGIASIDAVAEPLGLDPMNTDYSRAHWVTKNYSPLEAALEMLDDDLAEGVNE